MTVNTIAAINFKAHRYPYCIVWTPIPLLTWLFPIIGHMGIAKSNGVIRDFAGSYFVSEDNMGFGNPTRYLQLNPNLLTNTEDQPADVWDKAVETASNVYVTKVHNLCCDNCHSHVAMALNLMKYNDSWNWNMIKLAFWMFFCGKYVGFSGILKTWMPFLVCIGILLVLILFL